jgi:hypothetical protein
MLFKIQRGKESKLSWKIQSNTDFSSDSLALKRETLTFNFVDLLR